MASRSKAASRSGSPAAPARPSTATPPSRPVDLEAALGAAVKRIKEAGRDARHADSIRAHWELGRVLESLRAARAPADDTATGPMGSILLARTLGLKPTQVKMAGYLHRACPTPADRDRVLAMRRADGSPLRISVVARLCMPSLDAERESLLRRACDENWSETHVKERLGSRRKAQPTPHNIGGIPKPPASLSEAVARWHRRADEAIRHADANFGRDAITRLLEAADPDPVEIERVESLRERVKQVRKAIAAELKALDRIIEHLEQARGKDPAPAGPASKSSPRITRCRKPKR